MYAASYSSVRSFQVRSGDGKWCSYMLGTGEFLGNRRASQTLFTTFLVGPIGNDHAFQTRWPLRQSTFLVDGMLQLVTARSSGLSRVREKQLCEQGQLDQSCGPNQIPTAVATTEDALVS